MIVRSHYGFLFSSSCTLPDLHLAAENEHNNISLSRAEILVVFKC